MPLLRSVVFGECAPTNPLNSSATGATADADTSPSRRQLFARVSSASAISLASTVTPFGSSAELGQGALGGAHERVTDSYQVREEAARFERQLPVPRQTTNGDEQEYQNFIGNYSKGLPHNAIGEVDPSAYRSLLSAVRQGTAAAFEQVPLGGNTKLVNPLAGSAFDLEGTDSHQLAIPPFPAVANQALADEAVELYWIALCRDVPFANFATAAKTLGAVSELSKLPAFAGVTPQTLFRGFTVGDVIGPYISQFLLKPFN